MKIRELRVGDTWTWCGHARRVTTTPWPIGGGEYAFDTVVGPDNAPEHHRMDGDEEVEATR